jgi:long-chain-fatty-acid--[acyl-carrier-protein] ligase
MVVEYMYYLPVVHAVLKKLNAIPVPDNDVTTNPLKRKKSAEAFLEAIKGLKEGDNFLIYPAGRTKSSNLELIGGASGVHTILESFPNPNIVLVRTKGLWGSSFSRALIGKSPAVFPTIMTGMKIVLQNLLFFTPRRHIEIEYVPAPEDFPYKGTRLEINRYLENWYNQPDGLSGPDTPGDTLSLVSYKFWKQDLPKVYEYQDEIKNVDINQIPKNIKDQVINKISEFTDVPKNQITPDKSISGDLGLDSLDTGELIVYLEDQFDSPAVPVLELTTVGKMMAIASKQITYANEEDNEVLKSLADWKKPVETKAASIAEGKTLAEAFLNTCEIHAKEFAVADDRTGIMTFATLKLRTLILAEYIRQLPGERIGILLPASVAATLCFFAAQLAGKIPVMINWTVGSRHLESVMKTSGIQKILSSWAFLDKLVNVDLSGVSSNLIMLEDIRRTLGIKEKILGFIRSKKSAASLLKTFEINEIDQHDPAVILFTSGTENIPKGVPLTHHNIIENNKAVVEGFKIFSSDVLFGILPPFHSFGLTITSVLPVLAGIRVAYYPDPTDGKKLAKGVEKWAITLFCGAPTFIKKMLRSAKPEQLHSIRLLISGAEKAPPELFQLADQLGLHGRILEGYGITECSPVLSFNRLEVEHKGVGQAAPGVEIIIISIETQKILPKDTEGLILARGPNIFSGYLNKGIASPFITINGKEWYVTGDMGMLDSLGRLMITGRLKRFIKVGPEMVSLAAIEEALLEFAPKKGWHIEEEGPSVAVCAKEIPGEKPKIFVFGKFQTNVDDINKTLKEAGFANIVKVTDYVKLDEIPIMGTGKVSYRELESRYMS